MDLLACDGGNGLRSRELENEELSAAANHLEKIISNPSTISQIRVYRTLVSSTQVALTAGKEEYVPIKVQKLCMQAMCDPSAVWIAFFAF